MIDSYTAVVSFSLGLVVITHVYSIVERFRKTEADDAFVGMSVAHIVAVCLMELAPRRPPLWSSVRMEAQGIATIGPYEVRFLGTKEIGG